VYSTRTYTISSCAPTITQCPYGHVTTEIISVTTTICPVTETESISVPEASAPSYSDVYVTETFVYLTPYPESTTTLHSTEIQYITKTIPAAHTISDIPVPSPSYAATEIKTMSVIPVPSEAATPASVETPAPVETLPLPSIVVVSSAIVPSGTGAAASSGTGAYTAPSPIFANAASKSTISGVSIGAVLLVVALL
jgi:hypothetical protein